MNTLLGQKVVVSTLNPVPRRMRTVPGVIVITHAEQKALNRNNGKVWKDLVKIIVEDDRALFLAEARR